MSARTPREQLIYLALWRKAYHAIQSGEARLAFKVTSKSMGLSMRRGLYRAIKPYRDGTASDEILELAAETLAIGADGEALEVYFMEKANLAQLERVAEELGIRDNELLDGIEMKAELSLKQLLGDSAPMQSRSTPFYERD